jgi:Fe-S-cluster containining protein
MSNRSFDNDPTEVKRLIEYHNCEPMRNAKGELGIKIPMTCIHLRMNDSESECAIHDDKPIVCKRYHCGKAIEEGLKKLNGVCIQ